MPINIIFNDAESYMAGARFDEGGNEQGTIHLFGEQELNGIYDYERTLDTLLFCPLRRKQKEE